MNPPSGSLLWRAMTSRSGFLCSAGAFISFALCFFWLKEPEGAFSEEYYVSSVDRELAAQAEKAAQATREKTIA